MADIGVSDFVEDSASSESVRMLRNDVDEPIVKLESSSSFKENEANNSQDLSQADSNIFNQSKAAAESERGEESKVSKDDEDEEWLDILGSGHLKKRTIVKGKEDSRPHRGEPVIIDIVGKLENGVEFERVENLEITIGDGEVVQGIEYALPLMDCGETAELIVSPRFGYGSLGNLPLIPKDATLNYIVTTKEVLDIKEIPTLPLADRLTQGTRKKDRGNWWYSRKEYHLAIQCYRKALQFFEEDLTESNSQLNEARLKTYNNLSVAHFNIEAYDAALTAVNNVLSQEPNNVKAIYRKVKILKAQGEIEEAISVAKDGLRGKPDSPAVLEELNILIEMKKKATSAQKVLYRKMFKTTDDSDKKDSDSKRTVYRFTWKWLSIITVAVGIIGAAAIKFRY